MVFSFSDASFTGPDISFNTGTVVVVEAGGQSGGRVKKRVGYKLTDLGPRPYITSKGESHARLVLRSAGLSKAKLRFQIRAEALWVPIAIRGHSFAKLLYKTKHESHAKTLYKARLETKGVWHPTVSYLKSRMERVKKIIQAVNILGHLESIDHMQATNPVVGFEFYEEAIDPILQAFTHSSSFIGNVRYNRETQGMRILLNGKTYNFCNVPERIYDAFEGADSKGAYFARNIRTQFDC